MFSDDQSHTNAIGAFTTHGATVVPTGESEPFNVRVSNQPLSQTADVDFTVS